MGDPCQCRSKHVSVAGILPWTGVDHIDQLLPEEEPEDSARRDSPRGKAEDGLSETENTQWMI